jgi:hypothetical protein
MKTQQRTRKEEKKKEKTNKQTQVMMLDYQAMLS